MPNWVADGCCGNYPSKNDMRNDKNIKTILRNILPVGVLCAPNKLFGDNAKPIAFYSNDIDCPFSESILQVISVLIFIMSKHAA